MGGSVFRNYYTWTKPRGRVEAREGDGFGCGGEEWWGRMQTTVIE